MSADEHARTPTPAPARGGGPARPRRHDGRRRHAGGEGAGLLARRPSGCSAGCARSGSARRRRAGCSASLGVALSVIGPKHPRAGHQPHLRRASIGKQLPAGHHAGAGRRRRCAPQGRTSSPTCSPAWTSSPARASTSTRCATCCCSCSCSTSRPRCSCWLQGYVLNGVVQRTVLRLRARRRGQAPPAAAAATSTRVPRGELLSRVTNDIDNIQPDPAADAVSQLLTSLLTRRRRARR